MGLRWIWRTEDLSWWKWSVLESSNVSQTWILRLYHTETGPSSILGSEPRLRLQAAAGRPFGLFPSAVPESSSTMLSRSVRIGLLSKPSPVDKDRFSPMWIRESFGILLPSSSTCFASIHECDLLRKLDCPPPSGSHDHERVSSARMRPPSLLRPRIYQHKDLGDHCSEERHLLRRVPLCCIAPDGSSSGRNQTSTTPSAPVLRARGTLNRKQTERTARENPPVKSIR